ncbi:hypothetical protein [Amphiplicatus metriothermophilus]|uniref:Uncharacterized protein n=1 Tax=Amphiplicatus metriothermophilus TaxID=1519374 RepID=A0A239PJW5_9PROT|nr:hypothetical protein [Amphiplicatus metriothermophilus]MBB5517564.1 hypothetical protein [Amphiplicatus metriothermophilus]SNT68101.1 hypothetical protein SAMN06297382_0597 [Amphiplicatus metriothermophilus]
MDGLQLVLMLVCASLVIGWYLTQTIAGGAGARGLFAIRTAPEEVPDAPIDAAVSNEARLAWRTKARGRAWRDKDAPAWRRRDGS